MTALAGSSSLTTLRAAHPLDPLTPAEIVAAAQIVRADPRAGAKIRFASIALHEPPKAVVLAFTPGAPLAREAFVVLLDNSDGNTYEIIVALAAGMVTSWTHIPGAQPGIMLDEFFACEDAVKADPLFQAALAKRGITDYALLMVDPWSAGNYGDALEQNHRISRALTWVRAAPNENGYAHPIEGLRVLVDLNEMKVLRVEDDGVTPVPPALSNYTAASIATPRADLKTLDVVQPDGPSFTVEGYQVAWQKWTFRVGFTPREGLVLHTISYTDKGRARPILYRASTAEMVVPYGDVTPNQARKNAFDVGEYGIGMLANALTLGCDCLGHIHYFDANLHDSQGNVMTIPNAVCMHEEDYGILWKHVDWRTNQTEVRRSRRLVVSFIATVGNYEYGFFWYFYQDGSIQHEVKLTGIMTTGALAPGESSRYGTTIAPGLYAPNHQHFFSLRLDTMIDGPNNTVYEVHTEAVPLGDENPYGNAFYAKKTPLTTEQEAQQLIDPLNGRYWLIANPESLNGLGNPVAYKLMPGENVGTFAHPESSIAKRAAFMTKHLWVTPFSPDEKYPAGDYPNQHAGGDGLPRWTAANRAIENTDVVVWYSMGSHHIARPEDWPVMPCGYISFMLKPVGFFDENPALDVPAAPAHCHTAPALNGHDHNGCH